MIQNSKILIKRLIFPDILRHLDKPEITIITGPRQVGKTTLLGQIRTYLIQQGVSERAIYSFNLDVLSDRDLFQSQERFIAFLKERLGQDRVYVLVDEAQRVENAGIFFKGIYDLELPAKFILTGSSALEIRSKIHEPLTGRKRVFYLYPLSFKEYLSIGDATLAELVGRREISEASRARMQTHLETFLVWGGYPRVALETHIDEKRSLLNEIYLSYLERDIIGFLQIKNYPALSNLVTLLAGQVGQLVNSNELNQSLKIERKTVEKYLEILQETYIMRKLTPYFRNARKELVKMPKIYFVDVGIRNIALNLLHEAPEARDRGALLENFVFSEMLKFQTLQTQVRFWRTKEKAEVDFIVLPAADKPIPFEIKATALSSPEISRSFRSFLDQYRPSRAYIINRGFRGSMWHGATTIEFIHPYEVMSAMERLEMNEK